MSLASLRPHAGPGAIVEKLGAETSGAEKALALAGVLAEVARVADGLGDPRAARTHLAPRQDARAGRAPGGW